MVTLAFTSFQYPPQHPRSMATPSGLDYAVNQKLIKTSGTTTRKSNKKPKWLPYQKSHTANNKDQITSVYSS